MSCQKLQSFPLKCGGNIQPPDFPALGIKVEVSELDMFYFDLDKLADAGPGCRQIPHNEIPFHVFVLFQLIFQEIVVGIADHVFQKILLLDLDRLETEPILSQKLQEFASSTDNLDEVFENREQIEISRYYEKLPKPSLIATQEFIDGKIYFRNPAAETAMEDL